MDIFEEQLWVRKYNHDPITIPLKVCMKIIMEIRYTSKGAQFIVQSVHTDETNGLI